MLNQIKNEYPHCQDKSCHEKHDSKEILIRDMDDGCIQIIQNPNLSHFNILNKKEKEVHIYKIDRCLIPSNGPKRCDFAFHTSDDFYFVEIKDTTNRKSEYKNNAFVQLKTTIQKFTDTFIFGSLTKHAVIAWGYYPKRPATTSALQSKKIELWNKFQMNLSEGNSIEV